MKFDTSRGPGDRLVDDIHATALGSWTAIRTPSRSFPAVWRANCCARLCRFPPHAYRPSVADIGETLTQAAGGRKRAGAGGGRDADGDAEDGDPNGDADGGAVDGGAAAASGRTPASGRSGGGGGGGGGAASAAGATGWAAVAANGAAAAWVRLVAGLAAPPADRSRGSDGGGGGGGEDVGEALAGAVTAAATQLSKLQLVTCHLLPAGSAECTLLTLSMAAGWAGWLTSPDSQYQQLHGRQGQGPRQEEQQQQADERAVLRRARCAAFQALCVAQLAALRQSALDGCGGGGCGDGDAEGAGGRGATDGGVAAGSAAALLRILRAVEVRACWRILHEATTCCRILTSTTITT